VANQDDRQARTQASRRHVLYLGGDLCPDFSGDLVTVQDDGSHEPLSSFRIELYRKLSRPKELNRKGRKGDNPTGVPLRSLRPFFASFAVKLFHF
jgi:hypothetical protein